MTPLERLVQFYEGMREETVAAELAQVYAVDATFKDPFNEVRGLAMIAAIFTHMYQQVEAPRFAVLTRIEQGSDAFLTWEFTFRMQRLGEGEQVIRGATHIRFDRRGRVAMHRDYWDVAEELYEKLPLLGSLMRWLKRRAR